MYETNPGQAQQPPPSSRPIIDAGKLWSGGVATAVVAALIAVVGILVMRGVFDIFILAPKDEGAWEAASAVPYAAASAFGALVATGLMHVLLLTTPQPTMFFGWIMFLVAVVVGVWPFTTEAKIESQVATAALDVIIVVAIWSLVTGTAQRSIAPPSRRAA
jgi:hypothetical protein